MTHVLLSILKMKWRESFKTYREVHLKTMVRMSNERMTDLLFLLMKSTLASLPTRAINASVTVTSSLTDYLFPNRYEKRDQ